MKTEIFNSYVNKVSSLFNVDTDMIFTKTKRRDVVDARHLLYYLCSKRPMNIVYIQEYMSSNGYHIAHSSIHHGIKMVRKKICSRDKDYISNIKLITEDA